MDAHEVLIRATLDHFLATGAWPQVKQMQISLRHLGNITKLATEIGFDRIICEESADGVCKLTLKALASFKETEPDIQRFLHAIRNLADRYINSETIESIPAADLVKDLDLSDADVRRVLQLIYITPGLWTGASGSPIETTLTITPNPHVWYFEHVQTLDEFYSARNRAHEDSREAERARFSAFMPADASEPTAPEEAMRVQSFVHLSRLDALRSIVSPNFDLQRLIRYCEELNFCAENSCHFATVMLVRAIIDHVPPIFNATGFSEVANNHSGAGDSFKHSMQHLDKSARKIADSHLHLKIRRRESLPNETQVDFSRDLDLLLSEIVRVLS